MGVGRSTLPGAPGLHECRGPARSVARLPETMQGQCHGSTGSNARTSSAKALEPAVSSPGFDIRHARRGRRSARSPRPKAIRCPVRAVAPVGCSPGPVRSSLPRLLHPRSPSRELAAIRGGGCGRRSGDTLGAREGAMGVDDRRDAFIERDDAAREVSPSPARTEDGSESPKDERRFRWFRGRRVGLEGVVDDEAAAAAGRSHHE